MSDSGRGLNLDTPLFLLVTSSSVWVAALAWFAMGRARFRYKLAAVAAGVLLSGPIGIVVLLESVEPAHRNEGAGLIAMPLVFVWVLMQLACLAAMIAFFVKSYIDTRSQKR